MKFSIITPTHKRVDGLIRAVNSLISQTYQDWEMIIINDSPDDITYQKFASHINDPRIHYHINHINSGANFSRNNGLDKISGDSKWVIFLDDDDFLAPDALATLYHLILSHQDCHWFVTNRAYAHGKPNTQFPKDNTSYSYAWSYLITKRGKGDATHCIETKLLNHIRFSKYIKQGEEWFFFYQVGLQCKMFYHNHNSTITDGYDELSGLNFRTRTFTQQLESLSILFYEGITKNLIYRPTFILYLLVRFVRALVKHA